MSMPVGLEGRLAERIVGTAMCLLNPHPGNKILCTNCGNAGLVTLPKSLVRLVPARAPSEIRAPKGCVFESDGGRNSTTNSSWSTSVRTSD
jgi:hypothetical protein